MRVDVEADPQADMTSEYKAGARTDGLGLGRGQAAAQEHSRRLGDRASIVVKSWSRTQLGRSLSSAEAENYAIVAGATEALAAQALAEEMGWKMSVSVHTGLVCRQGGGVSSWSS